MPSIIVCDVDDTLLRNGREPIDKTISFLAEQDDAVAIVTGRTSAERDETIAQLEAVGVEYAMLLTNDTSAETVAYKRATMKSLLARFDVVLAIDNDADVRAVYAELGVEAVDPTNLPDVVRAEAGPYQLDAPGIEQKALPMDADQQTEDALEAVEGSESLCQLLGEQLADVVAFKMIAHGYHWNVKGAQFSEYHSLFGAIYTDADSAIDALAENILKLGYDAPFRLSDFQSMRELDEPALTPDTPAAMAASLLDLNADVLDGYNEAYVQSQVENQQGVANFLASRIDAHQKWAWQLRSSTGAQAQTLMPVVANKVPAEMDEAPEAPELAGMSGQVDPVGVAVPDAKIRSVSKISRAVEYDKPVTRANVTDAGIEQRIVTDSQIEFGAMTDAEDAGGMTFYGYAAAFRSPSEPLPFTETIAPGAFSRTLKSRNQVMLLMNHDTGRVLASRRAGTLRLSEDAYGLRVEADLPDTTDGRDLAVLLKRGDITSMSFGFTVPEGGDYWSDENNRELRDIRLHEVSVVAFPAYSASAAGIRSVDLLADKTGLDADTLAEAMNALERGDRLSDEQASVLEESVAKLRDHKPEPSPSIVELQAQLAAKLAAAA